MTLAGQSVSQPATPASQGKALRPGLPLAFAAMTPADVDEVVGIELAAYPFPWVRDNFLDSLRCGYQCWTARDERQRLLGYYLMMIAIDEAHLLNITVDIGSQGQGAGLSLLDHSFALARQLRMTSMLLEVRPSNARALSIYQRYGFQQIGLRKNYYPAAAQQREDAMVMRLPL